MTAPARPQRDDDVFGGIVIFAVLVSVGVTLVVHHWIGDKYLLAGIAILMFVVSSSACSALWGR